MGKHFSSAAIRCQDTQHRQLGSRIYMRIGHWKKDMFESETMLPD